MNAKPTMPSGPIFVSMPRSWWSYTLISISSPAFMWYTGSSSISSSISRFLMRASSSSVRAVSSRMALSSSVFVSSNAVSKWDVSLSG